MPAPKEVFDKVAEVLTEVCGVEKPIEPKHTLLDLGADSLDVMEIELKLGEAFNLTIPEGELFPTNIFSGHDDCIENGQVTEKGLGLLQQRMPFADLSELCQEPNQKNMRRIFTVDYLCRYFLWKKGEACGAIHSSQ